MPSLCGEVALITGSGRGLGRETAIALAKLGCHLAIVDIQEHLANDTAQFIAENYEVNTKAYKVDVRDYQQLLDLRKRVSNDLGDVTILVNNAAIITMSSIDDPPVHEIQRMININFTAPVLTTKVFLPKMRELNRGYVVNISSLAGMYPHHTFNVYGASKAAVRHLTSALRTELLEAKSAVKAITICPSFLTTNRRVNDVVKALKLNRILADLDGEVVAQYIIEAILRGETEITVPHCFIWLGRIVATLPAAATEKLMAFIGGLVDPKCRENELAQALRTDDGVPFDS